MFGAERCPHCGQVLPLVPPEASDQRPTTDIRFRRAFAGLVDFSIASILAVVIYRAFIFRFAVRTRLLIILISIAASLLPGVYLLLRDSLGGKSLGKLLVGLTVVNPVRHRRGGVADSLLRNLVFGFAVIPGLGWLVTLVICGIVASAVLSGNPVRLGEGLTDARVMDDREAEAQI